MRFLAVCAPIDTKDSIIWCRGKRKHEYIEYTYCLCCVRICMKLYVCMYVHPSMVIKDLQTTHNWIKNRNANTALKVEFRNISK